jgi:hypothetical protein
MRKAYALCQATGAVVLIPVLLVESKREELWPPSGDNIHSSISPQLIMP